ncbi:phage tail assembly protein [Cupriavidus sp. UGS-1]|uniref:phage tail assembly protein n=1 Tax=Cupriavidus sp. UGS-1 TaxID=2899826 RepID=UPI001E3F77A4|nr:phage tail assembly protein [Cupriavidus sp. UGS-1]MCD9123997.1 phage tail assembly protein [Cupriavidus sp. UGS-1]
METAITATQTDNTTTATAAVQLDDNTVTLDEPIKRGSQTITHVTLRKPRSGELRGVTLNALANLDVAALATVIPRISSPTLTRQEVDALDPADLLQMAQKVGGFLLPNAVKASIQSQTE